MVLSGGGGGGGGGGVDRKKERKREGGIKKKKRKQVPILPVSEIPHSQDVSDFFFVFVLLTPCYITGKPISTI